MRLYISIALPHFADFEYSDGTKETKFYGLHLMFWFDKKEPFGISISDGSPCGYQKNPEDFFIALKDKLHKEPLIMNYEK